MNVNWRGAGDSVGNAQRNDNEIILVRNNNSI